NGYAPRLVEGVKKPGSVRAVAPDLPGGLGEAMGALHVPGPAPLKREVDAVADVGERVRQPGPPACLPAVPEGSGDEASRDVALGDGPGQPPVGVEVTG